MKLILIGPGIQSIPPKGWGAVESLIWDYYYYIKKYHNSIDVYIINESNKTILIDTINNLSPDIVHLHYDEYIYYMKEIKCKKIIITSHFGYIDQINSRYDEGYLKVFKGFIHCGYPILCLSPSIVNIYKDAGCDKERLYLQHNGANEEIFLYNSQCKYPDYSIYLAKIDPRKCQYKYQNINNLYFAGKYDDKNFNISHPRFLGEWTKDYLYEHLTDYANLVLLSDGEAHALVCCEALMCGLGLVVSEFASANLDISLPFINIIPNEKLNDIEYISNVIENNRSISCKMRKEIREYALLNFSWKHLVEQYISTIKYIHSN